MWVSLTLNLQSSALAFYILGLQTSDATDSSVRILRTVTQLEMMLVQAGIGITV